MLIAPVGRHPVGEVGFQHVLIEMLKEIAGLVFLACIHQAHRQLGVRGAQGVQVAAVLSS